MGLQQSSAQTSLLVRCRISSGGREANPTGSYSSNKIVVLEKPNPDGTTGPREICCLFLADAAKGIIDDPTVG
jgi:hypothetical protein